MIRSIPAFSLWALMCLMSPAHAEQKISEGDYEVHYNAFSSTFLSPEVAKSYQIGRSKNRGILNVSVLKKDGQTMRPVEADLKVKISNVLGQNKDYNVEKITEQGDAVYYLVLFSVSHNEDIHFTVDVTPAGAKAMRVRFSQEFFTD